MVDMMPDGFNERVVNEADKSRDDNSTLEQADQIQSPVDNFEANETPLLDESQDVGQNMAVNSWWGMIRARFFTDEYKDEYKRQYQLQQLNTAIEIYPQVAVNYLLRAEYFLKNQRYHLAQDNFRQALILAHEAYAQCQWGIPEQAIMNRAENGLRYVQRFVYTERVHQEE